MVTLDINGKKHAIKSEPDTPLLWVLRDELALTGTKYGCGISMCGACTVHMDGEPIRSCAMPIQALEDKKISTIEHQKKDGILSLVQQKWLEQNVLKMNYKSFTQIVILGSTNFVPFMQLTATNRREVIEDLLDIKIFSSMNNLM